MELESHILDNLLWTAKSVSAHIQNIFTFSAWSPSARTCQLLPNDDYNTIHTRQIPAPPSSACSTHPSPETQSSSEFYQLTTKLCLKHHTISRPCHPFPLKHRTVQPYPATSPCPPGNVHYRSNICLQHFCIICFFYPHSASPSIPFANRPQPEMQILPSCHLGPNVHPRAAGSFAPSHISAGPIRPGTVTSIGPPTGASKNFSSQGTKTPNLHRPLLPQTFQRVKAASDWACSVRRKGRIS